MHAYRHTCMHAGTRACMQAHVHACRHRAPSHVSKTSILSNGFTITVNRSYKKGHHSNLYFEGFAVEPRQEYGEVVGIIVIEVPGQPTRCLQQITNILPEIHYQTQMPQFMNCKKDEWQTWYISYHFNFDLVPEPPV